jgi:fused signal recognition particle receptor
LEGIKQMELVEEPQPEPVPEPESQPEPQPEPDPQPEAVAEPAAPEQETTEVGDLLGDAPAKPLSESEMSKQIEESLSRILAESMKQDTQPATPSMGDTRVISPV